MSKKRSHCIFCNNFANSKEHLWPDWLEKHIPRTYSHREHEASKTHWDQNKKEFRIVKGSYRKSIRSGDPHSQRLRIVCEECNNGWMSNLQVEAKPLLILLINGTWKDFTKCELEVISKWIIMFTMVLEFKDKDTVAIKKSERELFKNGLKVPDGWFISLGKFCGYKWRGAFNHIAMKLEVTSSTQSNEEFYKKLSNSKANTQITTFTLGKSIINNMSVRMSNDLDLMELQYKEFADNFGLSNISKSNTNVFSIPSRNIDDVMANTLSEFLVPEDQRHTLRPATR